MDDMDVDQVVEVPDTPDRLAHNFKGKSCIRRDSHLLSTSNLFGNGDISNDGLIGGLRNKNEQATKRESKRMSIPPRKCSNKSELQGNIRNNSSGAALSSGSVFHLKRIAGDNIYNHGEKTSIQPEYIGKGKAISSFNSQMPAHGGRNTVVDLTEQDDHSKECPKIIIGSSQARQHRKELLDKSSSSLLNEDSANGNKFENLRTLNRTSSQKRLVRNGCISPLNVAKATQSAQKQNHSFSHSNQDGSGTSRELKAEDMDSHRVKGKGLLTHNILSKESDAKMRPLSDRTHAGKVDISIPANEDAFEQSNRGSGWISTRGRTRKLNPPLPDEEHLLFRRAGDPSNANKMPRNEVVRSNYKEGSNARKHPVSSQNVSVAPITQTVSQKHQGCQLNECPGPSNTVLKRKKQGSSRSHHGDSSSSVVDDSQLVVLGSPGEPSNIRSVGTQNSHTAHSFNRIINIDEISPETRSNSSYSINSSNNRESDVRARQLEADEVFARELQEQLYNESNVAADREIDENVALALQQGSLPHVFSSGTHHVSHSRSSLAPNLHRQNQSRPSQNASNRRVTQTRNPAPRMARLRGRFPGQSRTISSRQRNAMFPSDMDVDMRMHILEALEAFNDMGVAGNILQAQRDFNENDYEMLLALDENNHRHGGASASQINGLPESTVQMDNLEECSICLETPSIGDTIRHLPCLHKFHKDCIDEWLRRKTSCPVCKSSIT